MKTHKDLLRQFGHRETTDPFHVFGDLQIPIVEEIRNTYRQCDYDHRPNLHPKEDALDAKSTEEYRIGYACFKHTVARVLQPESIVEIGVGSGTGALAFLEACPNAYYLGIDNGTWEIELGGDFISSLKSRLTEKNYRFDIWMQDSQKLNRIPTANLVHVDGCHTREAAKHDMKLAWDSQSDWILIDDAQDSTVVAGVFSVLDEMPVGDAYWAYFEDTWTGNILIKRNGLGL